MNLTSEQSAIVNYIKQLSPDATTAERTILVSSVAGSGKTTLLTAIASAIPHTNGLYLAYNKSVATEAQRKFPRTTACSTTHSLAYRAVVKQYNLKLGTSGFTYRDIKETVTYEHKLEIIDLIREFCLSNYLSFDEFVVGLEVTEFTAGLCNKYLSLMESGTIECTHDFYLKFFHLALHNGLVTYEQPFDFIAIDEAGDLNLVTIAIFDLLPARIKIATGDKYQNIYSFNHTVNAFELFADRATFFPMTQSFRVKDSIASDIQQFCQRYIDPSMRFIGTPITDPTITTRAIITRTNAALVGYMIDLERQGVPFSLERKASEIYRLPLLVCSFKHNSTINDPMYRHVQDDINHYFDHIVRENLRLNRQSTLFSYLLEQNKEDFPLTQALKLVSRYGVATIMKSYQHARSYENGSKHRQPLFLATAHSVKGLEYDEVTIGPDLNDSVTDVISCLVDPNYVLTTEDINTLNLYYVACSRAKKVLNNALHLHSQYQLSFNFD